VIETQRACEEPETASVLRVAPEEVPEPRFPLLCAALWWALPAIAMIAGGWTAAMVLVAAGKTSDPSAVLTCGAATAVAVFGGMCLFERLVGTPGAALGAGVTVQLIRSPFVEIGIIPGWSATAGWVLTAIATGVLIWRAHARRPPLIRTAEPVVTSWDALDELAGDARPSGSGRSPSRGGSVCRDGHARRCRPWSYPRTRLRRSTPWRVSRHRRAGAPRS
jgi:hypothetical protein